VEQVVEVLGPTPAPVSLVVVTTVFVVGDHGLLRRTEAVSLVANMAGVIQIEVQLGRRSRRADTVTVDMMADAALVVAVAVAAIASFRLTLGVLVS